MPDIYYSPDLVGAALVEKRPFLRMMFIIFMFDNVKFTINIVA